MNPSDLAAAVLCIAFYLPVTASALLVLLLARRGSKNVHRR